MITAKLIADGRYLIGDEEYGTRLCVVDFVDLMFLSEQQLQQLANDIKDILQQRMNLEKENDQS